MWVEAPGIQSKRLDSKLILHSGWGCGSSILSWEPIPCTAYSVFTLGLYGFASHKTNFGLRIETSASLCSEDLFQRAWKGTLAWEREVWDPGAVTKWKEWGNSSLPESPWGSGCFPCRASFACLSCPCETFKCIEKRVKRCCLSRSQALTSGPLWGQVQRSCPCLPSPALSLCPLHLPCPVRHLFLLLLLIWQLKNSYNLTGNL